METGGKQARPERQATDKSLGAERDKTDEELTRLRTDVKADAMVAEARSRADVVLTSARTRADEELGRAHAVEDRAVREERSREDDALREERSERDARRRALASLLALEREQTDLHLFLERDRVDDVIDSRDDFLAMVSHDLRNMLGAVAVSAASLTKLPCGGEAGDAIARNAQRIQRYTARMNRLLGDLLDVVSIEAGHLALVPEPCDATELLRETVEVFQAMANAKKVSIRTEMRDGVQLAPCDQERILQVLANLVGNAVKFTNEGGSVHIVVEPVEHEVRFAVADTGSGIPPDKLGFIFERFWQVAKHERVGLGLGLYISKCIVEAHGGRIWADSRIGVGSAFYFTLPAADAAP